MKMKASAILLCGLLAVALNYSNAEQVSGPSNENNGVDYEVIDSGFSDKNSGEESMGYGDEIEEVTFREESPVGVMGASVEVSPEDSSMSDKQEVAEASTNEDQGSHKSKTGQKGQGEIDPSSNTEPKILKVQHTAQYKNEKPKVESGLGDWVFDYPK